MQLDRDIWEEKIKNWKLIWKKDCPFCKLIEEEKNLFIYETKFWEVRYNKYPYWWIKKHTLVFPKRHIKYTKELNEDELKDLANIHKFMFDFYAWEQYFSFIRETFSWRSIEHLHYHYMPGNIHWTEFANILSPSN